MAKKTNTKKPAPAPLQKPAAKKQPVTKGLSANTGLLLICLGVVIAGLVFYWPCLQNAFTNWDDPGYITQNYDIRNWTSQGIKHLWSSYYMGNYHPITMLTLAAEYHSKALAPYIYHRDSLALHILCSLAVTFFAWLLTRNLNITAFCGLLFVIHPMHVESVAWVAGRKDVLFGLFYFLALIAWYYYRTAKKNKILFYALCTLFFLASLLSKAVAVTLPISCLLVDYYLQKPLNWKLLIDKIPLILISIVFGIISIKAQQSFAAISTKTYPPLDRPFYASYAFLAYIFKFFAPIGLANFYPYPAKVGGSLPFIWYVYPVIVIGLLFAVYRFARLNKSIVFGFLFYGVAIFLLLQLLPVGDAIISDRYSYIAYFGLIFTAAYFYNNATLGIPAWIKPMKVIVPFIVLGWFLYLGTTTYSYCGVWKNTETLWKNEIEQEPEVPTAYNNLGFEYKTQGRYTEAMPMLTKCITLQPDYEEPYITRAEIYRMDGKNALALADLNKAISLKPNNAGAYQERAILYCIEGKLDSGGADFNKSIQLDPTVAEAWCSKGNYDDMTGNYNAAMADYSKALSLKPDLTDAYLNRGSVRLRHNQPDSAIADLTMFLQLNPQSGEGYAKRSNAWFLKKDNQKALEDAQKAQSLGYAIDPNYLKGLTGQ